MKVSFFFLLLLVCFDIKSQNTKLVLPIGNDADPLRVEVSPDGQSLICPGSDDVKVFDIRSQRLKYGIGSSTVSYLGGRNIFSEDGTKLVTISNRTKICVWNVADGTLLLEIKGDGKNVQSAMFASTSQDIISSYLDGRIIVWDGLTGQAKSISSEEIGRSGGVFFSPDDSLLLEEAYPNIKVYRRNDFKQSFTFEIPESGRDYSSTFREVLISGGNERLVAITWDSTLFVWDLANAARLSVLQGKYSDIAVSSDARTIAVVEGDSIKVYRNDLKIPAISRRVDWLSKVSVVSDGSRLLIASDTATCIYGIRDSLSQNCFEYPRTLITGVDKPKFTLNEGFIVARGLDGHGSYITLYDSGDGRFFGSFNLKFSSFIYDLVPIEKSDLLVTSSLDSVVRVWRVSGAEISSVYSTTFYNRFSTINDKYAIEIKSAEVYENSDTVIVRETSTGQYLRSIITNTIDAVRSFLSPDNKYLILDCLSGVKVFDFQSGKKVSDIRDSIYGIGAVRFIPGNNKVATQYDMPALGSTINIWDIKTGKRIFTIDYPSEGLYDTYINEFDVSSDGKYMATASRDKYLRVWSLGGKNIVKSIEGMVPYTSCKFSPDLKYLSAGMEDGSLIVLDMANFSVARKVRPHEGMIYKIEYIDDSKQVLTASEDGKLKILNLDRMEVMRSVKSGSAIFKCIINGKIICVDNAEVSVFDLQSGEALYSFSSLFKKSSVVVLPNRYYRATPDVARFLSWRNGDKLYGFEQFDIQYNRPDVVLEKLGSKDSSLMASYRRAYEKRLKKLSVDSNSFRLGFNVPEAEITNREKIAYRQLAGTLRLAISARDSVNYLDRYNVWINEIPLFGSKGISLNQRHMHVFDTVVSIQLADSLNVIEVSAVNSKTIESFRRPIEVLYLPEHKTPRKTFFVGIGINKFGEKEHNLEWSVKDIRDLVVGLKKRLGDFIVLDTLFDERVSLDNVRRLKELLMSTDINDRVIISYSGHGLLSRDFDYYLSTYQTEFNKPEKSSISYDEMEDLLDGIPARRKLLLIDACHSGEVDRDELAKMKQVYMRLNPGQKGGVVLVDSANIRMGMKSSFELMQQIFVNVGRGTGATVISAAGGMQFALEKGDLQNGVFTYSILEALEKYQTIKVSTLSKFVGDRVEELTSGMQRPTSRREMIIADWSLW